MTTLYRMADVPPEHWNKVDKDIQHFVRCGILAPVEPCAHGNYARHLLTILENHAQVWCPGSPDSETTDNQPVDSSVSAADIERQMNALHGQKLDEQWLPGRNR